MNPDRPIVMLVEDEAFIAMALESYLMDESFDVRVVSSGNAALAQLEALADQLACLVTDIRLPGADGWRLAHRARELVPTIPVVYMSGDSAADWKAEGVSGSLMLGKPFAMAILLDAVKQVMDARPASST